MAPSAAPRAASQAGCRSTAPGYGLPGGLPHGKALGRAAGHGAGSTLAPAPPVARRGAGDRSMARGDVCAVSPACGCGAGRGVGRRGMRRRLLPAAVRHRRRRKRERGGRFWQWAAHPGWAQELVPSCALQPFPPALFYARPPDHTATFRDLTSPAVLCWVPTDQEKSI